MRCGLVIKYLGCGKKGGLGGWGAGGGEKRTFTNHLNIKPLKQCLKRQVPGVSPPAPQERPHGATPHPRNRAQPAPASVAVGKEKCAHGANAELSKGHGVMQRST